MSPSGSHPGSQESRSIKQGKAPFDRGPAALESGKNSSVVLGEGVLTLARLDKIIQQVREQECWCGSGVCLCPVHQAEAVKVAEEEFWERMKGGYADSVWLSVSRDPVVAANPENLSKGPMTVVERLRGEIRGAVGVGLERAFFPESAAHIDSVDCWCEPGVSEHE